MPQSPGTRLGRDDVTALRSEGGMGQVWQTRDTTLDRDVALMVLPEAFMSDRNRQARVERDVTVFASLHRPACAMLDRHARPDPGRSMTAVQSTHEDARAQ